MSVTPDNKLERLIEELESERGLDRHRRSGTDREAHVRGGEPFGVQRVRIEPLLERFRCGFVGKCSPTHFFWGGFDLATTRFSGDPAPRHPGGAVLARVRRGELLRRQEAGEKRRNAGVGDRGQRAGHREREGARAPRVLEERLVLVGDHERRPGIGRDVRDTDLERRDLVIKAMENACNAISAKRKY